MKTWIANAIAAVIGFPILLFFVVGIAIAICWLIIKFVPFWTRIMPL